MAKYEALPTVSISLDDTVLPTNQLPELVHMEDPAASVMLDFTITPPHTIKQTDTLDHAILEMTGRGTHMMLVINEEGCLQGILSSADARGEKPIQCMEENRIRHDQVLVKMIMTRYADIMALDFTLLESARVGNIVKTLLEHKQHYALVISPTEDESQQIIRGIFTTTQLSKQLHMDLSGLPQGTESLSKLL